MDATNFCPAIGFTCIALFEPSNLFDSSKNLDLASRDHSMISNNVTFGMSDLSLQGGASAVTSIYGLSRTQISAEMGICWSKKITLEEN